MERNDSQGGYLLWEAALALPVLAALLAALAAGFLWAGRGYLQGMAEAELRQEIQQAFQRVVDDCCQGRKLAPCHYGSLGKGVTIMGPDGKEMVSYWVNKYDSTNKLVCRNAKTPITGNHSLANVQVRDFGWRELEPGLYRLWLKGYSRAAGGKEYNLVTEVYLPQ